MLFRSEAQWVRWLARFWGAWDRFDYGEAVRLLRQQPDSDASPSVRRLLPDARRKQFITRMTDPWPNVPVNCVGPARDLTADTIENGRRRLALGELEDALIRAYRVLELIGQIRLFTHGQDSGNVDPNQQPAKNWLAYKNKKSKKWRSPTVNKDGGLMLSKAQVTWLLHYIADPLAGALCNTDKFEGLDASARNDSNLIHGYRAQATTEKAGELQTSYDEIEKLFKREAPGNAERLAAARFPFGAIKQSM